MAAKPRPAPAAPRLVDRVHAVDLLRALKKDQLERGLMAFVRHFWHVVEPAADLVEGKAMEAICEHLEAVTDGRVTKLLINVPPGSSKSLLVNCFWVAWEWTRFPHLRSISFSYSPENTERDNKRMLLILQSPDYQKFWGDKVQLTQLGVTLVANSATGFSRASSVNGLSTGQRGDRVRLDDPLSVNDGNSAVIRTKVGAWFRDGMANRVNDLKKSVIVVIMQRLHEDDVSGIILQHYPDYCHLCIPAEFDPDRSFPNAIGWQDWRTEEGESYWPERFPLSELKRLGMTPHAYAGQYQQTPISKGGGILQEDWWKPWVGTKYPQFSYVLASLDTAFTEKQENDQSALTIWGVYADDAGATKVMLVWAWSDWLSFHRLVEKVVADCRKFKVKRLLIENKANGISVAQEMQRLYRDEDFSPRMVDPKNLDKVARAHAVAHLFYEGLVQAPFIADESDPATPVAPRAWADKVIRQCSMFPKGTLRDLVDSVTQALTHLRSVGMIDRKPEIDAEARNEAMRQDGPTKPLYPVSGRG